MLGGFNRSVARVVFLFVILVGSVVSVSFGLPSSNVISSTGLVHYFPRVDVTVNPSKVISVNNLSLGFMLDWEWKGWLVNGFVNVGMSFPMDTTINM